MTTSERQIYQRVNRHLKKGWTQDNYEWLMVHCARPGRWYDQLGPFYVTNARNNTIHSSGLDVDKLIEYIDK
jgi:hypothetical protein